MSALLLKSMTAGFSTIAVLVFISLLPYALLCYALFHAGKLAVKQIIPGLVSNRSQSESSANTSTLLNQKWAS